MEERASKTRVWFFKTAIPGSKIIPACQLLSAMLKYLVVLPEQRLYIAWAPTDHGLVLLSLLSMFLCGPFSDKSVGSTMRFGYNTRQTFVCTYSR